MPGAAPPRVHCAAPGAVTRAPRRETEGRATRSAAPSSGTRGMGPTPAPRGAGGAVVLGSLFSLFVCFMALGFRRSAFPPRGRSRPLGGRSPRRRVLGARPRCPRPVGFSAFRVGLRLGLRSSVRARAVSVVSLSPSASARFGPPWVSVLAFAVRRSAAAAASACVSGLSSGSPSPSSWRALARGLFFGLSALVLAFFRLVPRALGSLRFRCPPRSASPPSLAPPSLLFAAASGRLSSRSAPPPPPGPRLSLSVRGGPARVSLGVAAVSRPPPPLFGRRFRSPVSARRRRRRPRRRRCLPPLPLSPCVSTTCFARALHPSRAAHRALVASARPWRARDHGVCARDGVPSRSVAPAPRVLLCSTA